MFASYELSIAIGELLVCLIEAVLLIGIFRFKYKKAFITSFLVNFISFAVGEIIYLIAFLPALTL